MTSHVDGLQLRRILGREDWAHPHPFGADGWMIRRHDGDAAVIVTVSDLHQGDGIEWIHASISHPDRMPDYDDLVLLHRAVFGDRWAYQVFAPPGDHINEHPTRLHLWGRLDGVPALPNFGFLGSI